MLPDNLEEAHKMIEDLRRENADRRVKGKAYDAAFASYTQEEQDYLLDLVATTAQDQAKGAIGFRDLAFQMMGDPEAFLEGLDLPTSTPSEEADDNPTTNPPTDPEEDTDMTGLTEAQMQKILDDREAKAAKEAADAKQEADVQAIFAEIEALGFEQGTEGFMGMLSLAQSQAAVGKDVDFAALAPKVAAAFDITLPGAAPAEEAEEAKPEGSGKPFVSTADAGGAGGAPSEKPKDWIAEAKEKGVSPMDAARERAEARLAGN